VTDALGGVHEVPAKVKDRIAATSELLDRGFGKSIQEIVETRFVFEFIGKFVDKITMLIPESCPHCSAVLDVREKTLDAMEALSSETIIEQEKLKENKVSFAAPKPTETK
jgi:hypothetical protein